MSTSTTRGQFTPSLDKPFSVTLWGSNPDETDNDDHECLRERAVEAGMLHGVKAYNDVMDY